MASFKQVVKNYQTLTKLGQQIIQHKENIKHIKPSQLENEFLKQEQRIEQLKKLTKLTLIGIKIAIISTNFDWIIIIYYILLMNTTLLILINLPILFHITQPHLNL